MKIGDSLSDGRDRSVSVELVPHDTVELAHALSVVRGPGEARIVIQSLRDNSFNLIEVLQSFSPLIQDDLC